MGPILGSWLVVLALAVSLPAQPLIGFPTPNRSLLEKGGEEKFYVPTPGKEWRTGTFGCVRTSGWQLHEGLDIRCTQRDKRGEPADPIFSCADGTVAYVNLQSSLSNFGKYLVVRHLLDGVEVFSTYAHLSAVESGLKPGSQVKAGQRIATMGRTANTSQGISKERAHLHFELNLLVNERFSEWFVKNATGERNDHGIWNGRNLVGLDPQAILLEASQQKNFSLRRHLQSQTELFRVQVRDISFPWLKRYPMLVDAPRFKEAVAGYDLVFNFNGLPFRIIPKMKSELKPGQAVQLISVTPAEYQKNPCRRLVRPQGNSWVFTETGRRWIDLLCF